MRLSKDNIREIVTSFKGGESQASIARRHSVDVSTVRYHVQKYDGSCLYADGVYTLIRIETQHVCIHPSVKCSVCGKLEDTLRREDRMRILELEAQLAKLKGGVETASV